jgi:branched-chain amino acid transport system ATP-binding protein
VTAILQLRNVDAAYGPTQILEAVDLAVEERGITTLLGANGAGKTTTLRAICNMMVRVSGEIRFAGERIDGKATEEIVRRGVAHVPDGRGTFLDLTVEENLRIGAYTRRDKGVAADFEALQLFPAPQGAAAATGRDAIRRRAADAGHLARSDAAAEAAAA